METRVTEDEEKLSSDAVTLKLAKTDSAKSYRFEPSDELFKSII